MKQGRVLVEQVLKDGTVIEKYDTSLSPSEIGEKLCQYFPGLRRDKSNPSIYVGTYRNKKYAIRCKNVTYLGNPHPLFKKRIQIAEDLYHFYKTALSYGADPILLGLYTCEDNLLFVDFRITTYIEKKAHNSSAHVYTSDLYAATMEGYFQKIDYFGNTVTAFQPAAVSVFLDEFFGFDAESEIGEKVSSQKSHGIQMTFDDIDFVPYPETLRRHKERATTYAETFKQTIVPEIKRFFGETPKKWFGIDCYQDMINANYKNKYQPEWVGFYLEYCFEKYIKNHGLENRVSYYQDKKDGGIDLDLYFPEIKCFGDLKAHSEDSRGIQGNDWDTVFSILNKNDESSHIYYIVCEHATVKDSQHDYEVTKFWNTKQGKDDLLSYHKRMKNNVTLKRVYILDINYENKEFLTIFRQGINSNGKPRAPKIMLEHDNLKHFILEEINL